MQFSLHARQLVITGLMVALSGCAVSSPPLPVDDPVARLRLSDRPVDERLRDLQSLRRSGEIGEADYQELRSELFKQL